MAVSRPLFLEGLTDYTASEFRALTDAVFPNAGVLSGLGVDVTGPVSMNLTVAPGYAVIPTAAAGGGKYLFRVSALETVTVAASGALPRVDLIVAQVLDTEFTGATDAAAVMMIPGVPAAAPVPPALPAGTVLLGTVAVRAGTASITAADVTRRPFTGQSGQSGDLGYSVLAINADTCTTSGSVSGNVTGRGMGVLTTVVSSTSYVRQSFVNTDGTPQVWERTNSNGVWTAWAAVLSGVYGLVTLTTAAGGTITLAHGLGSIPSCVQITLGWTGGPIACHVTATTPTTATLSWFNTTTGAALAAGTAISFNWTVYP